MGNGRWEVDQVDKRDAKNQQGAVATLKGGTVHWTGGDQMIPPTTGTILNQWNPSDDPDGLWDGGAQHWDLPPGIYKWGAAMAFGTTDTGTFRTAFWEDGAFGLPELAPVYKVAGSVDRFLHIESGRIKLTSRTTVAIAVDHDNVAALAFAGVTFWVIKLDG